MHITNAIDGHIRGHEAFALHGKKRFSLANKQKSELFFCISLELFNNALFFDRRRSWAALVIFRNTFNLKGNLRLISL